MKTNKYFYLFIAMVTFPVQAVEVSKADWINAMTTALPTAFCNADQYFRQCFSVTAQECEETAASATRICLNKSKDEIPDVLSQPDDGTHWGYVVGACAGEAFDAALIRRRIDNEKCASAENWQ